MNRVEFILSLQDRLSALPRKELEERLAFYNEMIDDKIEDGLSEEEAVAQIGSIDEIVSQIIAETPLTTLVKEKMKPKKGLKAWEIVLLAVKPQNIEKVLTEMAPHYTSEKIIVSIAAGISAACIRRLIGCEKAKVVLVMPNTPMLIGYGAVAMSHDDLVTTEEFCFVKDIFSSAAKVEEIPAHLMNEVIPINGSSPAFIYLFAKLVSEYSDKLGIPYETANRLFCNTLIGSAQMMLQSDKTHQQLIDMVTSPGGTTFAMLDALKECDFAHAVDESFDRCIKRAYELGK